VTHVLIVDDHPMVRAGVEAYLEAEPGLEVAAAVSTVGEAEAICEQLRPDVLVSDYHLPDGDGLSLCLRLHAAGGPPTVIFSAFADDALAVLAAVAGARAVVPKSADPDELISAVDDVARGTWAPPAASGNALRAAGRRLDPHDLLVLGMIMHGMEPDDIARTLGVDGDQLCERRMTMLERLRGRTPIATSEALRKR
jgi:DNA-binding NarL/FixJ family response regulator